MIGEFNRIKERAVLIAEGESFQEFGESLGLRCLGVQEHKNCKGKNFKEHKNC